VLTTARLSKTDCYLLAQSGHTGVARAVHPAHSRFDGDAMVALASGEVTAGVNLDLLRAAATETVIEAVRAAVR
jgi:L-aminopeptidase/D-esterase-like protein